MTEELLQHRTSSLLHITPVNLSYPVGNNDQKKIPQRSIIYDFISHGLRDLVPQ
jgi:hypothetical protein